MLNKTKSFQALSEQSQKADSIHLRDLFTADPERAQRYLIEAAGICLDYSKNILTDPILDQLVTLAEESNLNQAIEAMFGGEVINETENRPALHTALRNRSNSPVMIAGQDVMPEINATLKKMKIFADDVRDNRFKGYTGKPLRTIVNIGIGGSYLGPKLVSDALKPYWQEGFDLKYLANIDGTDFAENCKNLNPETTLFVICSKSFSTLETLKNSEAARAWFLSTGAEQKDVKHHFVAVSSNVPAAEEFGINPDNCFPMWDWVGGRYSLWSAIGLPQAIILGFQNFAAVLQGAHDMDNHFRSAPVRENLPAIMGLLGIWYHNFMNAESHAVLVYDEYLKELPNHLQQLDMESNGKRVTRSGQPVDYNTGPVIWGGTGTNGQHAYHQLLHQGTRLIPCDFIMPLKSHNKISNHHKWLFANFMGQQQAMLGGRTEQEIIEELVNTGMSEAKARELAPHKTIPGNRPCNTLMFDKATPEIIGAIVAMYEHKVFVQGVIWDVNSFDQWGVELGKILGNAVYDAVLTGNTTGLDSSSARIIEQFRKANS